MLRHFKEDSPPGPSSMLSVERQGRGRAQVSSPTWAAMSVPSSLPARTRLTMAWQCPKFISRESTYIHVSIKEMIQQSDVFARTLARGWRERKALETPHPHPTSQRPSGECGEWEGGGGEGRALSI